MGIVNSILLICTSVILLWSLYRTIKHKPELFTAQKLNKSFFTMGVLTVILIVIIGFVVMILARQ